MPLRGIEHAISSARSNELIEWQTGKLYVYLTLRNSRINLTLEIVIRLVHQAQNILMVGENNKTFIGCFLNSCQICR